MPISDLLRKYGFDDVNVVCSFQIRFEDEEFSQISQEILEKALSLGQKMRMMGCFEETAVLNSFLEKLRDLCEKLYIVKKVNKNEDDNNNNEKDEWDNEEDEWDNDEVESRLNDEYNIMLNVKFKDIISMFKKQLVAFIMKMKDIGTEAWEEGVLAALNIVLEQE